MYNIGLVVGGADDQFSYQVSEGAMKAANENGDNLFVIPVKYLNRTEESQNDPCQKFEYQYNFLITYALSHSLDAIILCLSTIAYRCDIKERMAFLKAFKNIPVILVACKEEGYASVSYDNASGLRHGLDYMIKKKGCKHICMLSGCKWDVDSMERLSVYKAVLEENGISVLEHMVEYSDLCDKSQASVEELIKNNPQMDGLVCVNDLTAKAAYEVLNKHGLKIGQDVCVLGFDDWEDCKYMNPPLASVRADASELGYQAALMVHDSLSNGNYDEISLCLTEQQVHVETTFVNRTSVNGIEMPYASLTKETELSYVQKLNEIMETKHRMNVITRDMLMFDRGGAENFSGFLNAFSLEGMENCYLFLLEHPIEYRETEYVNVVKNLYLKAYRSGNKIVEFAKGEKMYSKNELFHFEGFRAGEARNYVVIDIYSREMQYGILVCDLPLKYYGNIESICFLISLATKIIDLLILQEEMLQKLEQENLILNNISNKDELTGISNRRGFITKTMDMLKMPEYQNKLAVLLYADLNYLKLINDKYSHAEGNFALQICAEALEQVAGNDSIVGRIGGDEFAVFKIIPCISDGIRIKNQLRSILEDINDTSEKPFEVSMSVGVYEFTISKNCELKELIKEADSRLYVDKGNKKPFVQR